MNFTKGFRMNLALESNTVLILQAPSSVRMWCHDVDDAVHREGTTQFQTVKHLERWKKESLLQANKQTCRKTFFLRNPGNPSYQIEASSCWTLEWATKAFCLYVIASFRRSRGWISPTCMVFSMDVNTGLKTSMNLTTTKNNTCQVSPSGLWLRMTSSS